MDSIGLMDETNLILLLSDSNLPTGSFVASSGLESFLKHGFGTPPLGQPTANLKMDTIATFIRDSLSTYAPSALPFVSDSHDVVHRLRCGETDIDSGGTLSVLKELDDLYECMTLNHVARRASKAQGVALLSLYAKGFSHPPALTSMSILTPPEAHELSMARLVDAFKLMVRRGDSDAHGHLPVCWGVLCAALGLSLERTQHLHLYLHARSLLSAAVRLNSIGPYAAQQILLHAAGTLVEAELQKCARLRTGVLAPDKAEWDDTQNGPANTWPLGEILAARHDLQHSRIFNS
ncbi:UreF-domain-containing protein [Mycena galericulata]|nr:UreF-domain-containing protein [Mycena galericulata]